MLCGFPRAFKDMSDADPPGKNGLSSTIDILACPDRKRL
jgi:hypothetical protein